MTLPRGFLAPLQLVSKRPPDTVPQCERCGLYRGCKSPKMSVHGKGQKGVLVVGEAPGADEDEQGRPFVGVTGQLLRKTLSELGVNLDRDCWTTNALICRPRGNKIPGDRMVDWCRPNLLKAVRVLKPRTVLLLGSHAVRSLLGWLWKEDAGGINRWAGFRIPSQRLNAWVCPTFHPSHVSRSRDEDRSGVTELLWRRHLKAAFRGTARPWREAPDYESRLELILDPLKAARRVREMVRAGGPLAFDFETTTLKPDGRHAEVYCCSVSDGDVSIAYPWHGAAIEATHDLVRSRVPKLGYNTKFESRWAMSLWGRPVRNWVWDGMIAAHILDNRQEITSLKFQAFANLGVEEWDSGVKPFLKSAAPNLPNRIKEAGLEGVLRYCAMDSLMEWLVCKRQMRQAGMPEGVA